MAQDIKGIYFSFNEAKSEITTRQTAQRMFELLQVTLDSKKIPYKLDNFTFVISGIENIKDVVALGGSFQGSSNFIAREASVA